MRVRMSRNAVSPFGGSQAFGGFRSLLWCAFVSSADVSALERMEESESDNTILLLRTVLVGIDGALLVLLPNAAVASYTLIPLYLTGPTLPCRWSNLQSPPAVSQLMF